MTLPEPPNESRELAEFPALIWRAHQPLSRIHRQDFASIFFGTDQDGRWNPPEPGSEWGTCYLSTHRVGAALEVFGRFRFLPQREIDRRVLATVYLTSDVRLADMTDASVLGRYGLTAEASTGTEETTYPCTQRWALRLQEAGFGGVYYGARHDPTLGSRSIALFGKASDRDREGALSEWVDETTATTTPIPAAVLDELRNPYGYTIVGGGAAL